MKEIDFSIDECGVIVGIGYHDGSLWGIESREGNADLLLSNSAGQDVRFCLAGCRSLYVDDFREGNIVDRIYLWSVLSAPPGMLEELRSRGWTTEGLARHQNMKLFVLECSYGATVLALVESVTIRALYE